MDDEEIAAKWRAVWNSAYFNSPDGDYTFQEKAAIRLYRLAEEQAHTSTIEELYDRHISGECKKLDNCLFCKIWVSERLNVIATLNENGIDTSSLSTEKWKVVKKIVDVSEAQVRSSERQRIMAELEKIFGNYWGESYLMGQLYDFVMKRKKGE